MSGTGRILLVDDEPAFLRLCGGWLRDLGHTVFEASDAPRATALLKQESFDLVVLDLALPPSGLPEEGLNLLSMCGISPVIVLTGHADREQALRAIERGAWDFLAKPVDPDLFHVVVARALEKSLLEKELRALRAQVASDTMGLIGRSPVLEEVRQLIRRIAPSELNVMVIGPSGTGKELVAKALHRLSPRRDHPFVPIHCGAIPADLLESELFGSLKGSFTGADRDRIGVLETAHRGVLFLDEIGEMPPPMQVKLLRFLQEGSFTPVGGRDTKHVDVRVICATHRDIERMVQEGGFREDLYYRIKGMIIRTVPLREHIEDLPILAAAFLQRQFPGRTKRLSTAAIAWLLEQPWRGNVRELENLLECAVALAGSREEITLDDVHMSMDGTGPRSGDDHAAETPVKNLSLDHQVEMLEKRLILTALEETSHNHSHTARRLGLSRAGLLKKMSRLGLRP
ncbi:MAG: sigma-54-dependent transcriptional regulator [Nitrospirota bacterium]